MRFSRRTVLAVIAVSLFAAAGGVVAFRFGYWARIRPQYSIDDRLKEYGPAARARITPAFEAANSGYPPREVTLLALKGERALEVWTKDRSGTPTHALSYRISGMSGGPGPKLREGDRQVPEGIYGIESLNPNSRYHLSLRVSYPNEADRTRARDEGRTELGGDIMIHGGSASIGCLAMGDSTAEDLFLLAADTGLEKVRVIIAPCDFRKGETVEMAGMPAWTAELHEELRAEMAKLR